MSSWKRGARERLIELRSQGLSFPQIAARINREFDMGVSDHACIGMARRMTINPKKAITMIEESITPPMAPETAPEPLPAPRKHPQISQFTIYDLNSNVCKWPLGKHDDHPPYLYCGMPAFADRPYCPEHCDIAYNAPGKRWQ